MPRTPARFTQADLARAARVAVETGLRVRVTTEGDIVLEREGKQQEQSTLDTEARCAF